MDIFHSSLYKICEKFRRKIIHVTDKPTRKESRAHARETARQMRDEAQRKEKRTKLIIWLSIASTIIITSGLIALIIFNAPKPAEQQTPNNMLYGGFSLNNPTSPILNPTASQSIERDSNKVYIDIYLDYLCPYCKMFEETQAETLKNVSTMNDNVIITYYPVPFLGEYSTATSNAITCVAEYQPETFWEANKALFTIQPEEGSGRASREREIQSLISDLFKTLKVNEEVAICVNDMRFKDYLFESAVALSNNPAPFTQNIIVDGTPFIIVNGEVLPPQYIMDPDGMFSYIDNIAKTFKG
jgi:protein-disulfide isomerase